MSEHTPGPCPFCGYEGADWIYVPTVPKSTKAVFCQNCATYGPRKTDEAAAIAAWNAAPETAAELERVRAQRDRLAEVANQTISDLQAMANWLDMNPDDSEAAMIQNMAGNLMSALAALDGND